MKTSSELECCHVTDAMPIVPSQLESIPDNKLLGVLNGVAMVVQVKVFAMAVLTAWCCWL